MAAPGRSARVGPDQKATTRRVALIVLAAAGLIVDTTIVVYGEGLIRVHAQQKMAKQLLVLQRLESFLSAMKDAETGQRGYLLTGDEPYLEPYNNALQVVGAELKGLQELAGCGELPQPRVDEVARLTLERLAGLQRTIELRRGLGLEAALALERQNRGKEVMDGIRRAIGEMHADQVSEFAETSRRANRASGVRTATFIGSCLVNLAWLGWAWRRILDEARRREVANLETRQRAAELAALLDAAPTPVFVAHDSQCRHITGNRAAAALLQQAPDAVASLSAPEQTRPRHFKAFKDGRELRIDELPAQRAAGGMPVQCWIPTLSSKGRRRRLRCSRICLW